MTDANAPYRSIGCSYYDRLEALAVRRTRCTLVFETEGTERSASGVITDLFVRDAAEYLRLDDGTEVRLDHLRSVDGVPVTYAC